MIKELDAKMTYTILGDKVRVDINWVNPKWAGKIGKVIQIGDDWRMIDIEGTELLFFNNEIEKVEE
jgi:hypothetical protein